MNRNKIENENMLNDIYLERTRYMLSVDDILEDILERR